MTPVTLVTTQAESFDTLSLTDYRDMVIELRQSMSIDKLITALNSQWSKALWAKVEHGEAIPNRSQRNELRRYFGKPLLPMTVAEATAQTDLDAAVWRVGDGIAHTVVMVTETEPLTLHVNGAVTLAQERPVTTVTNGTAKRNRTRAKFVRPCATATQERRRIATGASWAEIIEAGLHAMEMRQ